MIAVRTIAWTTIAAVLFAGATFLAFGQEYLRNREIAAEIAAVQAENERLTGERLASVDLLNELSSTYWLETQARRQGLAKPGESVIIIPAEDQTDLAPATPPPTAPMSNPEKWLWTFLKPALRTSDSL
jgi:cell division protein FtsB